MARLTRMQKYAERRKEMANENEASQNSSALDAYKNKLEALEANFNELKKEENNEINIEPIPTLEPKQESVEETPSFEEAKNEFDKKEEKDEFDFLSSLDTDNIDKAINDLINQKISILEPNEEKVIDEIDNEDLKETLKGLNGEVEETKEFKPEEIKEEVKPVEVIETPIEEVKQEEPVTVEETKPEIKEAVKPEETVNIIEENYSNIASTLNDEVKQLNGEVEPVKEEEKVLSEIKQEPVITKPLPVKEKEVVNIIDQDYKTIATSLANIVEELDGKVEPVKEEEKVLPKVEVKQETKEEVKEDLKVEEPIVEDIDIKPVDEVKEDVELPSIDDISIEPVEENTEISVDDILANPTSEEKSSSYVDETLKEVEEYNKQDGRKTADDVKDMIVDDLRHNKPEEMDNEEFANTVSLEIDKVLSEINTDIPSIDVADVTLEDVVKPIEVNAAEVADKLADTLEHPVLAQSQSEEEPIEIKSMEETFTQDVVDDTIPFMMEDVKENKEVEYEEIDDEKPNKILNVILIILIAILVIILGVIVYYLLYAKGIIG